MYEEFVGHPLRKDYPKEKRQPLVRRLPDEVYDNAMAAREVILGVQDVEDLDATPKTPIRCPTEPMTLNMGPSHPAMHGTVRIVLTSRARRVVKADVQVGYLHRGFEKEAEHATWTQVFPYTDRLNYVSPMLNNVGYALAVEKLLGIVERVPERAQYIRVIVGEMSRITDHLTCMARWRDGARRDDHLFLRASRRASGSGKCSRSFRARA